MVLFSGLPPRLGRFARPWLNQRANQLPQIKGLLLPVLNLDDARLILQSALGAKLGHTAFHILSVDDESLPRRADDKALVTAQQGFQQLLSIAAAIHGPDATALCMRPD